MSKEITDEILSQVINNELASADTWQDADLAEQQASNLEYYYGQPFGNEKSGFSQVVTRDVMEAVEGIMPELMKIFTSGDNFVQFEPTGVDDMPAAEQATDYVNYVFQRRMNGFEILYKWFKDALLMKNGMVKVGWTSEDRLQFHTYKDISEEELEVFETEDDTEVDKVEEQEDGRFTVRVRRTTQHGRPYVEHIPSEEFRIKQRSKSIKDSDFVAHVTDRTLGDMLESGFDEEDLTVLSVDNDFPDTKVEDARFSDPDETSTTGNLNSSLPYEKTVEVVDAYVRLYDHADGKNKVYHVIQVGNKILEREEVETVPFISLSPILMPHKFTGVAVADLVRDIQEIRSELYRQTLNNLALTNAGRYEAVEGQVRLQDLIDNKIGGVVRTKVAGAVRQLPTPMLGQATFPFLNELEEEKENRVGVSKMTQGLDPNALTSNTAATAVNQVMTAAQQKILLIARIFAETGVKELFWELYRLVRTHQDTNDIVRLRGKFVEVAPFDWIDRHDMQVTVGIGNGNKDQQLFHLNNISNILTQVGNTEFGYMINADNVYNLASEFINNAGYKNTQMFITDPSKIPPPEPSPDPVMIAAQAEAAKDQAEAQYKQAQLQLDMQKQQLEQAKFEWNKKVEAAELGLEATQGRAVGIGTGK